MLDRSSVFSQLQNIVATQTVVSTVAEELQRVWQEFLAQAGAMREKIASQQWQLPVSLWNQQPDFIKVVEPWSGEYGIVAVDGSQVYPDRYFSNQDYCLINTGGISVSYRESRSTVSLFSQPSVYSLRDILARYSCGSAASEDLVDLIREEFEFKEAFARAQDFLKKGGSERPFLALLDGSFIFWHLEGKPLEVRDLFLSTYMLYLKRFHEARIPVAGYISLPRNRELCNVLRILVCENYRDSGHFCALDAPCACKFLQPVTDVDVISLFLRPGSRTGIFTSKSSIVDHYFTPLKPCFFFLHVGDEIGRVELPLWMAESEEAVDFVACVVMDQAKKGFGYPLVLAESHEQAVVKHADKLFFYDVLQKLSPLHSQGFLAQKSMRKRSMPV